MQLIDLSGVQDFHYLRFLLFWIIATVVAVIVAYRIGPEKKMKWFKQRKTNRLFERRGWFGNLSLLGVPHSKMGFAITGGIFASSGLIYVFLVYLFLPLIGYPI